MFNKIKIAAKNVEKSTILAARNFFSKGAKSEKVYYS
jgi:hypothetical protein